MIRAIAGFVMLVASALVPLTARAYSDPAAFADPVENGGGGGRFFTGSPADGYTCGVCHGGGHNPELVILGLPVAGYQPGLSYEVTVTWPKESENIGLALEITDRQGKPAGKLRLPPDDELLEPELCLPIAAGIGAAVLSEVGERTVASVPDCGAKRMRMLWSTPVQDIGPVWLTGSVVASNAQGDVKGDGVTDFSRVIPSPSARDAIASKVSAGCRIAASRSELALANIGWLAFALAALWIRRQRATRNAR